ncbi:MAG: inositol monophosphatase family protein [Verrucomicrobiota bacterium]
MQMIHTAIQASLAAGELIRSNFGREVQVNESTVHDIKIQTDIDSQDLIYSIISKHHPDHRLIGEEGDSGNAKGEVEWIVDPIDGTINFAMGIPHFCVSIAARKEGKLLLGVIYDPIRNDLFTVEAGGPTYLNGRAVQVSSRNKLSDAIMAVGFAKTKESVDHCMALYNHYGHAAKKLRAMGSAALDLAYVSCGRLDAYIEQGVSLWDIAAGWIMVEQAGGKVEVEVKADGKYRLCASSGRIEYPLR